MKMLLANLKMHASELPPIVMYKEEPTRQVLPDRCQ